jgi:hypothetical protein
MALTATDATDFIMQNAADVEDWSGLEPTARTRFINVANRILTRKFKKLTIPDSAVYLYANSLCVTFNDTNRYASHGVQSFSVSGVASFSFFANPDELGKKIPLSVLDEISDANSGVPVYRRAGMAVY